MIQSNPTSPLFPISQDQYGADYRTHLLEQYKIYVESIERNSDRRQNTVTAFLVINSALVSVVGLSFHLQPTSRGLMQSIIGISGVVIGLIFFALIRSHRQLAKGKFEVLHEIERNLPLAPYSWEWHVLQEGKAWRIYWPFSHIEQWVPLGAALAYAFFILWLNCRGASG